MFAASNNMHIPHYAHYPCLAIGSQTKLIKIIIVRIGVFCVLRYVMKNVLFCIY
jgi:hypothetical protein